MKQKIKMITLFTIIIFSAILVLTYIFMLALQINNGFMAFLEGPYQFLHPFLLGILLSLILVSTSEERYTKEQWLKYMLEFRKERK